MKRFVLAAAAAASLMFVAGAMAHAEPATITPGNNAVLATPPTQVVIEMSQEMARQAGANDIEVIDSAGKKVTATAATIDDSDRKKLTVALPANLAVGVYVVNWKTLSADDGDAADGSFLFTFDPSKPPAVGTVTLSASTGPAATAAAESAALNVAPGSDSGVSWVLLVAVGVGMLAVGGGGTFLLVTKRS